MGSIISPMQGAFIEGKSFLHNILLCQDIVKQYGQKNCSPSCLLKIDLRKTYHTLDWDFLHEMLTALNFPRKFTEIIMACVTSTPYSLVINCIPLPTFQAKRGVRQGDPLSPLIFIIGMKNLSRSLNLASEEPEFKFHPRCRKLKLNHPTFANNLMLLSKGDLQSISILIKTVNYFSSCFGVKAKNSKSGIYLVRVSNEFKDQSEQTIDYSFESLPIKYLGMPLTSKRYSATDCEYLVDKMTARIRV